MTSPSSPQKTCWSIVKSMPLPQFTLICMIITIAIIQFEAFDAVDDMYMSGLRRVEQSMPDFASVKNVLTAFSHETDDFVEDYSYDGGTAFCLLTLDDNDIMSEWVGYHYHVFKMRRLIVAVDPNNKITPWEVLRPWTAEGSNGAFDLKIEVWENDKFMPDYFQNDYTRYEKQARFVVDPEDADKQTGTAADIDLKLVSTQYHNETFTKEHPDEVRTAIRKVNDHRFRQKYFIYKCFNQIKEERKDSDITWAVHIDTDEYLVPNPWINHRLKHALPINSTFVDRDVLKSIVPKKPRQDSLIEFFQHFLHHSDEKFKAANIPKSPMDRGCVMVPRALFGAGEDYMEEPASTVALSKTANGETLQTTWSHSNFNSIRFKYHQDFNSPRAGGMKGILNVDTHNFTEKDGFYPDEVPSRFPNIHRPSKRCPIQHKGQMFFENDRSREQPMAIYHYLGSLERYMARGDGRRNADKHQSKDKNAAFAVGDSFEIDNDEPWWIKGWFDSFVETHGADAAYSVFGSAYGERVAL